MSKKSEMSFEQAFARLEEIVRKLESGSLSLDESLELYERGQALATYCNTQLDKAELKIQQLITGPDGAARLEPFKTE